MKEHRMRVEVEVSWVMMLCTVEVRYHFQSQVPWRRKRRILPKSWYPTTTQHNTTQHGATNQKNSNFYRRENLKCRREWGCL